MVAKGAVLTDTQTACLHNCTHEEKLWRGGGELSSQCRDVRWPYVRDGRVQSRDLEVGVGGRGAVSLHGDQPGRGHLVGVLQRTQT